MLSALMPATSVLSVSLPLMVMVFEMALVPEPSTRVKVPAVRGVVALATGAEDHVEAVATEFDDTVKLEAVPEALLTIARREPLVSVTTLAVTPNPPLLIWVAKSLKVLVLLAIVIVPLVPPGGVMVKLPAGSRVVLFATGFEYHDAVLARLFTTTTWLPTAVADTAEPERMLGFEEATALADNGPTKLLRDCMSLSRLVMVDWMVFRSVVWLARSVCCACHARSVPRAA
jgi:hypothetical protein